MQSFNAMTPEELNKNPQAMAIGERLFMNNCSQCHGSDARGSKGFPNLTDNDWLGGGTPEIIKTTITQGRTGNMPPMAAARGTSEDVSNVAQLCAEPVKRVRMTRSRRPWARPSSASARPATATTARAIPRLVHRT
jgi:cbb3-type cytochrome c oxidase subunit III